MADEETIVIKVNAAQGEAALKALGAAGIKAGTDISSIETAAAGSTDKIAAFGAKLFGLTKIAATFGEVIRQVGNNIEFESDAAKEATSATADLFTAIGSLDAPGAGAALGKIIGNLEAMRQGLDETTLALGNMANAGKAANFADLLKVQNDLIQGHEKETEALNRKSQALSRIVSQQQQSGTVQKFVRDEIQATLDSYEKSGEAVPAALADQAAALGIVSKAQQEAAASALELEKAGVKSAEERAKAEAKAAEEVVAALEKERIALDAKLAQDQARLATALAKGGPLDTSEDPSKVEGELQSLRQEIKRLEDTPMISPDQLNALNEAKDRAAKLGREVQDLNNVFTVGSDNWLNDADAANAAAAAQDVYGDMLAQAQMRQEDALRTTQDADDALTDFSDTAEGAAEALGDVAAAAGEIGDETKKGADKAKEAMSEMVDGLNEAIPLATQLKGILAEIVALGAQADI